MTNKRASANSPGLSAIRPSDVLKEVHFEATQIDDLIRAASIAFDTFPSQAPVSAVLNAAREKMTTLCTILEGITHDYD